MARGLEAGSRFLRLFLSLIMLACFSIKTLLFIRRPLTVWTSHLCPKALWLLCFREHISLLIYVPFVSPLSLPELPRQRRAARLMTLPVFTAELWPRRLCQEVLWREDRSVFCVVGLVHWHADPSGPGWRVRLPLRSLHHGFQPSQVSFKPRCRCSDGRCSWSLRLVLSSVKRSVKPTPPSCVPCARTRVNRGRWATAASMQRCVRLCGQWTEHATDEWFLITDEIQNNCSTENIQLFARSDDGISLHFEIKGWCWWGGHVTCRRLKNTSNLNHNSVITTSFVGNKCLLSRKWRFWKINVNDAL